MWCMDRGLRPEQEDAMPADWGQYGRAAGMIRNRNMCRKGAYLCVAFLDWCRARAVTRCPPQPRREQLRLRG